MKPKQILTLTMILLGVSLAREAQAFYNPSTGRWLSRDPITVITSRKHQESEQIRTPYEETYQSYWRLNVLESDPGEVKIIIIGQKEGGAIPIHDRWLITKTSGLRLGSSINSIGFSKAAEVSDVEQKDLPALQELLNKYSSGSIRLITGERLLSSSFDLWI